MRMTADDIRSGNRLHGLLFSIMIWGAIEFICAQAAYAAVPVDIKSYDPASGVVVRAAGEALVLRWDTPEGSTELMLNISGQGALVQSIAVAPGKGKPVVVLRDVDPVTVLSIGQRDLKKRGGWTIFFDRTSRKPSESGPLTLKLKSVAVRSVGRRCIVELDGLDGLEGQSFSGKLRFTLYAGCDLIHLQAVVQTKKDARALLYHSGLTCDPADKAVSWIGLDNKAHRVEATAQPAEPEKVRNRTIALETKAGALAVFPPPHRYFYPLDEAYNLGFTWRGNDFMDHVSGFGIGVRQDLQGDGRWVPWFNAPPGTQQELGIFWLASLDRGNKLFDRVKAYTHGDRFPRVPGHKTFTSHYHIEHTLDVLKGQQNVTSAEVVPTSRQKEQDWRYSLTLPPKDWMQPAFDDQKWKTGQGGFGKKGTPGLQLGTDWNTQDIWLRRIFKLREIPADELKLSLLYDEDTEIYLNGVLAFSVKGFSKRYREVPISPEARKALKKGDNLMAVHCWNDGGGQAIDAGLVRPARTGRPTETQTPEFVGVFKKAGVDIVHLAEFHNRLGRDRRNPDKALPLLKLLHDECARLSDDGFLLLPGEEPNAHLGGHWISFFPRPVMWVLNRSKGKPFMEDHPRFGRVYHVGSPEDVLKLMEREGGLMWAAHPRIKSSTGYPDLYRDQPFFKSDRYLGGAWKAMPADLSKPRLGWRVLDLLDDTANWGAKKYIVGEVDIFQVDRTTEFYAHANVNYLRLDHIPRFEDGWEPVLKALRDGAFFISTGEVLMPRFRVGEKQSGQTLKLDASGQAELEVELTWTFPMSFAEVITGNGKQVHRKRIDLTGTGAFGKQTLKATLDLTGKSWVRLEAWDVAANGVISQPIWLE